MVNNFIHWNQDPILFQIGDWPIVWYGVLFGLSFLAGYTILLRLFKKEGTPVEWLDSLAIYVAVGTFVGARLGHCLFYEPEYYLSNPLEILMIRNGGLASHGAAIGIITALFLYSKYVSKRSVLWGLDRVVIVVALSGLFIRMGNFMNSEILGSETTVPWGVVFQRDVGGDQFGPEFYAYLSSDKAEVVYKPDAKVRDHTFQLVRSKGGNDPEVVVSVLSPGSIGPKGTYKVVDSDPVAPPFYYALRDQNAQKQIFREIKVTPRHPSQIYEAFGYLLIFVVLLALYFKPWTRTNGRLFGMFLVAVFFFRFLVEFLKKEQVAFEEDMTLNMGQLLSIPFVLMGLYFILRKGTGGEEELRKERNDQRPD